MRIAFIIVFFAVLFYGVSELRRWRSPEMRDVLSRRQKIRRSVSFAALLLVAAMTVAGTYFPIVHHSRKIASYQLIYWSACLLIAAWVPFLLLREFRDTLKQDGLKRVVSERDEAYRDIVQTVAKAGENERRQRGNCRGGTAMIEADRDRRWMRRALRLAVLGREAAPNPMVGCVIVAPSGMKIGEGYHVRPGEPHAEVNALNAAESSVRGATAYVTLEPCSHYGRTPPCANALIAAGIARVVVAMTDPDPRVSGSGLEILRSAGIRVETGVGETEARRLNIAYSKHRQTGLPFIAVKTAMTLDGKIATVSGDSRWITSAITRLWVHRQLRARYQAVVVGIGTALADDPSLDVRLPHRPAARNPLRIVVDSHLRLPLHSKLVASARRDETIVAFVDDPARRGDALQEAGVHLLKCEADGSGRVDLRALLARLGHDFSITSVLVEGGAELTAALFEARLVDRYYCTIGPKIVGGAGAPGPIGGAGLADAMEDAVECTGFYMRRSGKDLVICSEFA